MRIWLYSHHQHGNALCHQVALSQAKRARGACSTGLRAINSSSHLKLQPSWLPLQLCHSTHCAPTYPCPNVCNIPKDTIMIQNKHKHMKAQSTKTISQIQNRLKHDISVRGWADCWIISRRLLPLSWRPRCKGGLRVQGDSSTILMMAMVSVVLWW